VLMFAGARLRLGVDAVARVHAVAHVALGTMEVGDDVLVLADRRGTQARRALRSRHAHAAARVDEAHLSEFGVYIQWVSAILNL